MSPVLRPSLFTSLSHPTRTLRLSSAFDIGQTTATTVAQQTLKKREEIITFPQVSASSCGAYPVHFAFIVMADRTPFFQDTGSL